jgi:hypothetical protein
MSNGVSEKSAHSSLTKSVVILRGRDAPRSWMMSASRAGTRITRLRLCQ